MQILHFDSELPNHTLIITLEIIGLCSLDKTTTIGLKKYEVSSIRFQTFFVWELLLIVHTWNASPLRSNLLRLQCICCAIQTTSGRPHEVILCERVNDLPHSLFHLLNCLITTASKFFPWALGITKSHREHCLDYKEAEEMSWCPSWSNSLGEGKLWIQTC